MRWQSWLCILAVTISGCEPAATTSEADPTATQQSVIAREIAAPTLKPTLASVVSPRTPDAESRAWPHPSPTASATPPPAPTLTSTIPPRATTVASVTPSRAATVVSASAPPRDSLPAATVTALPEIVHRGQGSITGDLADEIARLENDMPRAHSEGFLIPAGEGMAAFSTLVAETEAGELDRAAALAAQLDYSLTLYVDEGDNQATSVLLRESRPIRRGWGLYVLRQDPSSNIVVEAPHPLFDEGTPALALAAYRRLHARALLVAGAHRHANRAGDADVAHRRQTVFEAAHETLADNADMIVLQIHGFSSAKHPGYPQVVVSSDEGQKAQLLGKLLSSLAAQEVRAVACDGIEWAALCGETNIQSRYMKGGTFVHLEVDDSVRAHSAPLLAALTEALR